MNKHIVIARYLENISWISEFNTDDISISIYNKGNDGINTTSSNVEFIPTPNTGREAKTYLDYIVSNYKNLPKKIIFTQGHPNDHVSPNYINEFVDFLDSDEEFKYFSTGILKIMKTDSPGIWNESGNLNHGYWTNNHTEDSPCIRDIIKIFPKSIESGWEFGAGAIFGVSKKCILSNSIEFYLELIQYLNSSEDVINPIEAHVLERMWKLIFSENV